MVRDLGLAPPSVGSSTMVPTVAIIRVIGDIGVE